MAQQPKLILWGWHPRYGGRPIKLDGYTKTALKDRTAQGWICGAYAIGQSPDGLIAQVKRLIKQGGK